MVALSAAAHAADASAWDGDQRAAMRLVAGAQRGGGAATIHHAGIEIRLAPGWKTYWRYPGDSGVPPRFDFTGSRNLKSASVRYPAPHRLLDEGGTSIGYKGDVVFPIDVVPQDASQPVVLKLKIEYALCEKICVPAEGAGELTLTGRPASEYAALAQGEARVPAPARIGDAGALAIRAVRRESARILVDVAAPDASVELFAEGPTGEWALPVPSPIGGAPAGQQRFVFELDGLPPGAKPDGAELRLTAVAGGKAIEVPYRLD
ncbi:MAG TPA: protein-disulfide reductase DsbD domain-containing protein [Xanthobacteraceae bacterium]|nr:protein-disulfide reductase DsbD domain-containing protein [Xanthobacteraceae bacterium]